MPSGTACQLVWLKHTQSRDEIGVYIESPVKVASNALEVLQRMSCAMQSKVSNSSDHLELGLFRHVNPHQVGVDLKANDGMDITKDLFVLLMRQANAFP